MKQLTFIFLTTFLLTLLYSCKPSCNEEYPTGMDLDYTDDKDQAMDGDDIISYYNGDKVTEGTAALASTNNGIQYLFSNSSHKSLFDSNPDKYMPGTGGYCVVAAAFGKIEAVDKQHYGVYKGKLYFTTNKKAHDMWLKDQEALTQRGEAMWPCLVSENGRKI